MACRWLHLNYGNFSNYGNYGDGQVAAITEMPLPCHFLFKRQGGDGRLFAPDGAAGAVAELADIKLEFGDGAREGIAVHAEFAGGFALIAFVLLKHIHDEALFEFADSFRIKNSTGVHLSYECFKLVLHGVLSFARSKKFCLNSPWRTNLPGLCSLAQRSDAVTKLLPHYRRSQPACTLSRYQKISCQL
jgi:hypothetical protein